MRKHAIAEIGVAFFTFPFLHSELSKVKEHSEFCNGLFRIAPLMKNGDLQFMNWPHDMNKLFIAINRYSRNPVQESRQH